MKQPDLEELLKKYKRGWYRKGKSYRFLHAVDPLGMLLYQIKSKKLKNSNEITGVNRDWDDWFDKADYVGLELPEE